MRSVMICAAMMAALVLSAVPAVASLSWNYDSAPGDGTSLTSPYSWATVDTFSGIRPGWTYTGNGIIRTGDVSGKASAPFNPVLGVKDNTPYLAVPENNISEPFSVTVDFGGGSYKYLGLHWGSMDSYNEIEFFSGAVSVGTITGSDVGIPAGGQQTAVDNAYVNIFSTEAFDSIVISSYKLANPLPEEQASPYAFELDNLAVPVPGAVLLGMLGLGVAGARLRKRA